MPLALPTEIISSHIAPNLSSGDVLRLIQGLDLPISGDLYRLVFNDHTRFHSYDVEMFWGRAKASVYAIGAIGSQKSGIFGVEKVPAESMEIHKYEEISFERMTKPVKVPFEGILCEIVSGEGPIEVRTSDGELFFTGRDHKKDTHLSFVEGFQDGYGVDQHDKVENERLDNFVTKVEARQEKKKDLFSEERDYPIEKRLLASWKLNLPVKHSVFTQVTADEAEFFGLDEDGIIWHWQFEEHPKQGIPLGLVGISGVPIKGKVLKIVKNSALIEGVGIVFWANREASNGWRGGYPCKNGRLCASRTSFIPHTANTVVDYVIAGSILVYLSTDGKLYAVRWWRFDEYYRGGYVDVEKDIFPLENFNVLAKRRKTRFVEMDAGNGRSYAYTRDCNFITLCEDGTALTCMFGTDTVLHGPEVVDLKDVVGVAAGSTHFLALTANGEVFSWGTEKDFNGCLGLGTLKEAVERGAVNEETIPPPEPEHEHPDIDSEDEEYEEVAVVNHSLTSTKPLKIDLPGKVYAVFAGNGYSGFVMN